MSYDVIVVGAGSAGAALAARLSEEPQRRVLLLEAGPDYRAADSPDAMHIPNSTGLQRHADHARYRWDTLLARRSERQTPRPYLRGRGLGGSSAVNGQVAIRAMPDDFDRWAAAGCTGWSGAEVLAACIRLEDDLDFGDAPYHGRGGPIPVWRAPLEEWGAVDVALRQAALAAGQPWSPDHNAPVSTGISPFAVNSRAGRRVSTNDGYLEPARSRPNLVIRGDALVSHITFAGRRARGVRVRIDDAWYELDAGEIVVCAGALHSPGILIRSGIGPADDLVGLDIPVLHAAPVGENLLDHTGIALGVDLRPEARATTTAQRTTNCCVRYSSGLAGAGDNDMLIRGWNVDGYDAAALARGHVLVATYENHSQGRLTLTSRAPDALPDIDLSLLSDQRDLVRLRDGVRRLVALMADPAYQAIATTIETPQDSDGTIDLDDDERLDRWLLTRCGDVAHAAGTCRMGATTDLRSVVDPAGRVIGVERLRVVDASIMPLMVRANIHLTTVMLAEHLAARWDDGQGTVAAAGSSSPAPDQGDDR